MFEDLLADKLIETLYHAHFVLDEPWDVERLVVGTPEERRVTKEACDDLCARGLARYVSGSFAKLTPEGIRYAEERGLADPPVAGHNRRVREALVGSLERSCIRRGPDTVLAWQVAQREAGVRAIDFERNIEFIVSSGLAEWAEPGCLRITHLGRQSASASPARAADGGV